MVERPILFNGEMVRAILEGRKTQTRRILKPKPEHNWNHLHGATFCDGDHHRSQDCTEIYTFECPYGQPGDRLWVRESISLIPDQEPDDGTGAVYSVYVADGSLTVADAWPWKNKTLPSIHCPRGLSRITLEVTGVRVERLNDISEEDAISEGCRALEGCKWHTFAEADAGIPMHDHTAVDAFGALWENINGPGSWDANPWVWVIEFKRLENGGASQ